MTVVGFNGFQLDRVNVKSVGLGSGAKRRFLHTKCFYKLFLKFQ